MPNFTIEGEIAHCVRNLKDRVEAKRGAKVGKCELWFSNEGHVVAYVHMTDAIVGPICNVTAGSISDAIAQMVERVPALPDIETILGIVKPPPYPFCRQKTVCAGRSSCPRDPACNN